MVAPSQIREIYGSNKSYDAGQTDVELVKSKHLNLVNLLVTCRDSDNADGVNYSTVAP